MNLTSLRTQVAAPLSLNTSDTDELALIDQWINDGVVHVLAETGAKVSTATAVVTASEPDYELDDDILRILWIQTSDSYELLPSTPDEILRRRLNGVSDTCREYAVNGANLLMLYPTPAAAATLTIYYVPRPATLASGSDSPSELPAEYHYAVVLYALWRGADYDDDQTSAQGSRYMQLFDAELARCKARQNKKRGRRLAPARVSTRARIPARNDIA